MKNSILLIVAITLFSCTNSINEEKEKAEIISLLQKESQYAANADISSWASCWVNSDEASFIYTDNSGNQSYFGFNSLKNAMSEMEPFDLKLSRENYHFVIGKDMAFVSYDQTDNWGDGPESSKKETRTLKKVDGEWKIANTSVVNVSSFIIPESAPFHIQATKLHNPENGLTNVYGLAGMSIGYVEVSSPTDFTPFFKGLPHDMCNARHWGYVIDGAARVFYADGKEDLVKAGEVFYTPPNHSFVVDKSIKFIDISPDSEFRILMDQFTKNLAAAQSSD